MSNPPKLGGPIGSNGSSRARHSASGSAGKRLLGAGILVAMSLSIVGALWLIAGPRTGTGADEGSARGRMVSAIVQKVRQTPLGPVNSRVFEVSEATFAPDSGVEFLKIWEAANGNRRAVVRVVVSVPPSDTLSAFLGDQPEPVLMPVRAGVEEGPDGVRVGKVDAQTDVLSDHVGDGAKKGLWSGVKALF